MLDRCLLLAPAILPVVGRPAGVKQALANDDASLISLVFSVAAFWGTQRKAEADLRYEEVHCHRAIAAVGS